ncbi:MAG: MarR family transcriptional regulator [Leucobacter sp.]|nr:MarR family transcriptional regulator [Leucobacter sp.]
MRENERVNDVDPLLLERQVCFALSVASRSVIGAYKPVLDPLGITHPQYLVMLALWEHHQLSLNELAHLLSQEPSTLSPLVKRLEREGFVTRVRSASDERRLEITLTEAGEALRDRAIEVPGEMARRLGMSLEELVAIHQSMLRLVDAAKRAGAEDGEPVDPR